VAYQVFIDQFVHHPLLYFPFFYTLKELVNGGPIDGGIKKYMTNYKEDLVALWKLWVPSTFLNFALMPMWARIPWVATTSLLWTCILSAMRGSEGTFEAHEELAQDMTLNPGRALTRVLSNMESDYDRTQAHIVINAAGPDRVGYVHALASAMTNTGGNLIESKMMRLGGDFTVMLLMSCPPEKKRAITKALPKVEGMNITVRETTPWEESGHAAGRPEAVRAERFRANLLVTGPDQPGMLEAISGVCSKHKIDIKELSCKQFPVWLPDGNKQDNFHMRGYVRAFETVDVKAVRSVLDDLERKHKIKVILDTEME
jgi:glycine cleavage system regulatory protein